MHFVIVGSGAVGGYFGARLQAAGEKVTFIARGEHCEALQAHGLILESINGNVHLEKVKAVSNYQEVDNADVIFIAVKTFQIEQALKGIEHIIGEHTRVVPLLNGINSVELINQQGVENQHIYGGLAKIISRVKAPGIIAHTGAEPHITLGLIGEQKEEPKEQERLENITKCLTSAHISIGIATDINIALWRKFLFVGAWGALASLIRTPIGEIRTNPRTRPMLIDIVHEYAKIADAIGVKVTQKMVDETINFIDKLPPLSQTSMQRDIAHLTASEFEALVAYPYRKAKHYQVKTPVLNFCYACLDAQVSYTQA